MLWIPMLRLLLLLRRHWPLMAPLQWWAPLLLPPALPLLPVGLLLLLARHNRLTDGGALLLPCLVSRLWSLLTLLLTLRLLHLWVVHMLLRLLLCLLLSLLASVPSNLCPLRAKGNRHAPTCLRLGRFAQCCWLEACSLGCRCQLRQSAAISVPVAQQLCIHHPLAAPDVSL